MRAKPNYNRFLVNIPADLLEWMESDAQRMTREGGGLKAEGGKGYFGVSDVIIRLVRDERERETRRERMRNELPQPPPVEYDQDHTVCIE